MKRDEMRELLLNSCPCLFGDKSPDNGKGEADELAVHVTLLRLQPGVILLLM